MSVTLNTNTASMRIANLITQNSRKMYQNVVNISSGQKPLDAMSLVRSRRLESRAMAYDQSAANLQDAAAFTNTAENAVGKAVGILEQMRDLALNASNATITDEERKSIADQYGRLAKDLNSLGTDTKYNNIDVFSTVAASLNVYWGEAAEFGGQASTHISLDGYKPSLTGTVSQMAADINATLARGYVTSLNGSIDTYIKWQSEIMSKANGYLADSDDFTDRASSVRETVTEMTTTDLVTELPDYVRNNISTQAGQLILAQQNQNNYAVLNLLSL